MQIPNLLRLYQAGILEVDDLITQEYSLDQVQNGYDDLAAGIEHPRRGEVRHLTVPAPVGPAAAIRASSACFRGPGPLIADMIETIHTDRLCMRPFEASDLDALTDLHREESFWWYPMRRGMSPEETTHFLSRVLGAYQRGEISFHALIERSNGSLIGWAGLSVPTFLPRCCRLWRSAGG